MYNSSKVDQLGSMQPSPSFATKVKEVKKKKSKTSVSFDNSNKTDKFKGPTKLGIGAPSSQKLGFSNLLGVALVSPPVDFSTTSTTIKNISGVTMSFSWIPPHGKKLEDDEEFIILGDIHNQLWGVGYFNPQNYLAFNQALADGLIEVTVNVPDILYGIVDVGQTIHEGDFVYLDSGKFKSADQFTWDTNLATTQTSFANAFAGIAQETVLGTGSTHFAVDKSTSRVYSYSCTSQTHLFGGLLGPAKKSASNALEPQKLETVASVALAVARATHADTSAAITVSCSFQPYGVTA